MDNSGAQQYLILDRDGVINEDSDDYIKTPEEWQAIDGSLEAIAKITKAGINVVVVTNQSGIGRGFFSEDTLNQMHNKMLTSLDSLGGSISNIFYCPHLPTDDCSCRKPATGLVDQAEAKLDVSLKGSPLIGDSEKDILLAKAKGCLPILVRTGKGQEYFNSGKPSLEGVLVFNNLASACEHLLEKHY